MKKYVIVIGEVALCLLAILIISVAKSKHLAGWLPNIIMIGSTTAIFFYARQELPKWGMTIPIAGSIGCLIAHFSRIGFQQGLAIWNTAPMLLVAVIAYLAREWQDQSKEKGEQEAKEAKETTVKTSKVRLKSTLDDSLAQIDQDETNHFLGLVNAVENAKDDVTAFTATMADHEAQWQERLRVALLPFDSNILTAEEEVREKESSLDEAELVCKNLNAQKFQKNTPLATIEDHERQVQQAEQAKNAASTELKAAKRTLGEKRDARAREEQSQQVAILALRNADQAQLQSLQTAIRAAERAESTAKTTDKQLFATRRRTAQTTYDKAIARL